MSIPCLSENETLRRSSASSAAAAPAGRRARPERLGGVFRRSWQGTPTPRAMPWVAASILSVVAAFVTGLLVRQTGATQAFFAENGPVELLQAGLLAAVALVFVAVFRRSSDSRALFCVAVAGAIVLAMTREIPRCGSPFYDGGLCMSGGWKNATVAISGLLAVAALVLAPIVWRRALHPSNLRWVWPVMLIAGIVGLAELAETFIYIEIEEALELAAYLCLGGFGLQMLANARRQTGGHDARAADRRHTLY